jgi:hypothetical protein
MVRGLLPLALLLAVAACVAAPPMHWQKPGTSDAGRDEAECRAGAHEEAAHQLPYGDGPPIWSDLSMLQWTMAIDNQRSWLAADLVKVCMYHRGFALVPVGPS